MDAIAVAIAYFNHPSLAKYVYLDGSCDGRPWTCPRCGGQALREVPEREGLRCRSCGCSFSARQGSIVARSRIPLTTWAVVMWAEAGGAFEPEVPDVGRVTDYELGRAIGKRPGTVASMRRRLRAALGGRTGRETGIDLMTAACFPAWAQPPAAASEAAQAARGAAGALPLPGARLVDRVDALWRVPPGGRAGAGINRRRGQGRHDGRPVRR